MATSKKLDDSIRVKILSAMQKKGCIQQNVRRIQKETGFHRATIKSSIDFLEKNEFIKGYRPLLESQKVGYNLNIFSFLQTDLNDKTSFNKLKENALKDSNVIFFSDTISESNYNIALGYLSKDIEDFHNNIKDKYQLDIPNYLDFVKKQTNFFQAHPFYKNNNRTDALINLLKKKVGME